MAQVLKFRRNSVDLNLLVTPEAKDDEDGASWGPANHGLSLADSVAFFNASGVDLSGFAGTEGSNTPYVLFLKDSSAKLAWGYCFPQGTGVWTDRGLRQIAGIKKDDLVLTHTGRYKPVTNCYKHKHDDDLIILSTYMGKEIKVTPEHPFLASKDGLTAEWIDAQDIRKGDWLVFVPPKGGEPLEKLDVRKYKEGIETNLPDEIEITNEFLQFLGLYVSEGCVTTRDRVNVRMNDFDALYPLVKWAQELGLKFSFGGPYNGKQYSFTIPDLGLAAFLESEFGFGAGTKQLPKWIFSLSDEDRLTLLLWMVEGDGCVQPHNVKYYSISKRLCEDVVLLLAGFGIASDIKIRPPRTCYVDGRTGRSKESYAVSFTAPEWLRQEFGLPFLKKHSRSTFGMRQEDGRLFVKVQDAGKEHYEGFVYNLGVADDNSYAVDLATVHNCGAADAAEAVGAELLSNIGFETAGAGGADIWADWLENAGDGALANEVVIVHGGADSCKATAGPSANARIYQGVTVVPGKLYKITFYTYGDGTYDGRYQVRDNSNHVDIIATTATGQTAAAWAAVTVYVTAPSGCTSIILYLRCPSTNTGIAYFDDTTFKNVTDVGATGLHIVNQRNGSVRNWASIESGFDYNDSAYTFGVYESGWSLVIPPDGTGYIPKVADIVHGRAPLPVNDVMELECLAQNQDHLAAEMVWLKKLASYADSYIRDRTEQHPVWLHASLDAETGERRALVRKIKIEQGTQHYGPGAKGNIISAKAFVQLGIERGGAWERAAARDLPQATPAAGASVAYDYTAAGSAVGAHDTVGDTPARIGLFSIRPAGADMLKTAWLGIRSANKHGTLANFVSTWELEDGTNNAAESGITDQVDATASGGNRVQVVETDLEWDNTWQQVMVIRPIDVTANYGDNFGLSLWLLRTKATTGKWEIRLKGGGYNDLVEGPVMEIDTVDWTFLEQGIFVIPSRSLHIFPTSALAASYDRNFRLEIYARRTSGAGNLYLDCLCPIPIDEGFLKLVAVDEMPSTQAFMVGESPEGKLQGILVDTQSSAFRGYSTLKSIDNFRLPPGDGRIIMVASRVGGDITDAYILNNADEGEYCESWYTLRGVE